MMVRTRRRALNILGAICSPFLVQAIWLVLYRQFLPAIPKSFEIYTYLVAPAIGFAWLALEFRLYSIPIALVYFPAMFYLMVGFSMSFVASVYGDM